MNQSILMGRLTRDPEVRYSSGEDAIAIANFRMAVDRPFVRKDDEEKADFFSCTAFGKRAEFVEDYLKKGVKVLVTGRLQNDNYTNRDGDKVYAMKIIVNNIEFAESKKANQENRDTDGNYEEDYREEDRRDRSSRRDRDNRQDWNNSSRRNENSGNRRSGDGRSDRGRSENRRDSRSDSRQRGRRDVDDEFRNVDGVNAEDYAFN